MLAPASPPPTTRSPRIPEGLRLALAAALAAAVVLAVLVAVAQRAGGANELETAVGQLSSSSAGRGLPFDGPIHTVPPPSADTGPRAGEDQAPGVPAGGCPDGTMAEVCDAVAFIEAFKGDRPFKTFPVVNFIDGEAFDVFILEDFDDSAEALRDTGDVLRSLGLIEADVDLFEAWRTTRELSTVGAYNTETEELNINGTEVNIYTQMVMVHELTHAWDDQYFELARPEYADADSEIGSGFLNAVEGSATLTENAWRAGLSADQQSELEALEFDAISPEEMEVLLAVPFFVLQLQISPYTDGGAFVQAIYDDQGIDGVDRLFADPPTTTEQVLHVDAYLNGEEAAVVPVVSPPTGEFDRGVMGELTFNLWFGADIGSGWGGDEYVSWRTDDAVCTTLSVVGDNDDETNEFRSALDSWASQAPADASRTVDLVDGVVIATACI